MLVPVSVFCSVMAMYPWALKRTRERGYDFPIYYATGLYGKPTTGFVYSPLTVPVWWLLARLRYRAALWVVVGLTALSAALLAGQRPALAAPVIVWLASYAARHGNITTICAAACLHPLGALVASCFKPHLLVFWLLHLWAGAIHPLLAFIGFAGVLVVFWPDRSQIDEDMAFHAEKEGPYYETSRFSRYILRKDNLIYLVTAWILVTS